ncbi:PspA/IM30 family protein [Halalkalibacter akibai]|uniref:PspA/IM30 family protein n=1 Tax=Halalkalibacter akibai (strain ATCC 43226 / DSM 21942 / CIP 109018 / JCM 9157 / 1139) TaxID=1236973 RepID=W4QUC1_HALA3|nr:PspA/IM30 family protein [Halalkalibacter akibai]GAE35686.1 hypothetical protein JCM9157_2803 [Halalkalibacter akibai JCM 9157]
MIARIKTLIKAYVYEGLDKLEDPAIMVKQYKRDIKKRMEELEENIQKQCREEKNLQYRLNELKELFDRKEEQAKTAVQAEDDELARKILLSKKEVWSLIKQLEQELYQNKEDRADAKVELEQLQLKYKQLKEKDLELIVRIQHLKNSKEPDLTKGEDSPNTKLKQLKNQEEEIENELRLLKAKNQ